MESLGKTMKLFSHPSHRPWKSIMPISTFPRHDYDEDKFFLKPAGLRDTHSEGKVNSLSSREASINTTGAQHRPFRVQNSVWHDYG
jgi:hypothetical protein